MSVEVSYTSCACNQTPNSAHWGKNNLICYASCNSIRIYDPKFGGGGKIINTLCGHTERVNCVRWISGVDSETELVSGSSDGTAIVWTYRNGEYIRHVLSGHEGVINIVDALYKSGSPVVATSCIDCTIKLWTRKSEDKDFVILQSITLGHGLCMALRMCVLPQSNSLLLASGMDNSIIQLFIENDTNEFSLEKSEHLTGHENWVKGFDFIEENGALILATASQDALIQLWRISLVQQEENCFSQTASASKDSLLKRSRISTKGYHYTVSLESVLAGHESWVYSVSWNRKNFTLLSASLDKSMIIWALDKESGLWLEKVRVGEVGGNTLGFYGGMFSPSGQEILAHGYHGAFHIWKFREESNTWEPSVTVGGHFNEATDLAWEPHSGEFVYSVSYDQTTRIHAPWTKDSLKTTWHEIARPQVHGYDMNCLAILSRYHFASGAEEKIIRIFKAPNNFIENFRRICHVTKEDDFKNCLDLDELTTGPKGAAVPSLGLSNKAVYENDNLEQATTKNSKELYPEESHFTAVELFEPPTEETLLQNTLWPEVQKLYGHGYEVYCLATNSDGSLLASACKASNVEHSKIILWDMSLGKQIGKLQSHNLTVVQLAFSPDSRYLLSVSRDRRWTLFGREKDSKFELIATTNKSTGIHTRIIWCCSWSYDSQYFATGSRDGKVAIWTKLDDVAAVSPLGQCRPVGQHLELKGESITALAFAPAVIKDSYVLAIGLESGIIKLYLWSPSEWRLVLELGHSVAHHLAVKRLAFRPKLGLAGQSGDESSGGLLQLASCGSDYAVRIYSINLETL